MAELAIPSRREMIAQLIAQNTISSSANPVLDHSNLPVIDLIADWAQRCGFAVKILDVPGAPGKYNLVATLGSGEGGLVLAGHADTVPCDTERWQFDPFQATEHDGRLYGLGSCDMKSFLALAVAAAGEIRAGKLARPLHLVVTADEETTMAGARALAESGALAAEAVILGEPTHLMPVRMHKGIFMERLTLTGRSGHSSNPAYGNNALEGMHTAIGELLAIRAELEATCRNTAFMVPTPTLNLGGIEGGDNPNRICGACALAFDVRVLPAMDVESTRTMIHSRVAARLADSGLDIAFDSLFDGTPPAETAADAPIVRAAEEFTGEHPRAVAFGTEAAFYQRLGMDVLILGPGSIFQAHQPDEYLDLDYIDRTVDLLGRFIDRFCVDAAAGR